MLKKQTRLVVLRQVDHRTRPGRNKLHAHGECIAQAKQTGTPIRREPGLRKEENMAIKQQKGRIDPTEDKETVRCTYMGGKNRVSRPRCVAEVIKESQAISH